jgi:hypothetical protein
VIDRVLNPSNVIFNKTKINESSLPETKVLTKVLRAILPDTEVSKQKDSYPSDGLVNKAYILDDQETPKSDLEV